MGVIRRICPSPRQMGWRMAAAAASSRWCTTAARLPNPRDTGASGGRLRLPADRGLRGSLGAAEELALALSASLRVMGVIEPPVRCRRAAAMDQRVWAFCVASVVA